MSKNLQLNEVQEILSSDKKLAVFIKLPPKKNLKLSSARRGGAAISDFRGGLYSPHAEAKTVRTISRIDHHYA